MNIFLIGYRGCGKTAVGQKLSTLLKWPFIDTDAMLVKETGMSIADMVAASGWDAFRKKESEIIRSVSCLDRHVIATGGGAVLDPENVARIKKNGLIVWLTASSDTIRKRLLKDPGTDAFRPALSSMGTLDETEQVLARRRPVYEAAMDVSVCTDSRDILNICQRILEKVLSAED